MARNVSLQGCAMPDYNKHTRNEALQRLRGVGDDSSGFDKFRTVPASKPTGNGKQLFQIRSATNPFDEGKKYDNRDRAANNIEILPALKSSSGTDDSSQKKNEWANLHQLSSRGKSMVSQKPVRPSD